MIKELHVHMSSFTLPRYFYTSLYDTEKALYDNEIMVDTTQTHVLSTTWLLKGYRIFVHMLDEEIVELKIGKQDNKLFPDIRVANNIEKMVLNNCFGFAVNDFKSN